MISADKRRVGRCGIAIVACMMLDACAAAPTVPAVTSDIDPSVDFSRFRTYRVLDSDVRDADQHLGANVERMIVAAIFAEFPFRADG